MVSRPHPSKPQELLHFIELDEFAADWNGLGLDVEHDLWDLQNLIMVGPKLAPIIEGTGALRKLRFAPERWNRGKSGAARICYAYFEKHRTVLLVMAYGKNEKETLSKDERAGIKVYLEQVDKWFSSRRMTDD